jgi:hypothetical protein
VVELRNASNQLLAVQLTDDAPTLTATLAPRLVVTYRAVSWPGDGQADAARYFEMLKLRFPTGAPLTSTSTE